MKNLIIASMALALLAGCTTIKRATGQIDDSTLPGQRADILPPDQQTARDPNVAGNMAVAPGANGSGIAQTPMNPPPGNQVAANMPTAKAATGSCDPKVDLCPEPLAPDPVAPISPVKPVTPIATTKPGVPLVKPGAKAAATPMTKPAPGAKPTPVKVASKPATSAADAANGNLDANQVLTDPTKPAAAAAAKPVVKKKIAKKKVKPTTTTAAAPADATAPAVAPAPAAPAPAAPVPQGQ